jgi:hypothetical protein
MEILESYATTYIHICSTANPFSKPLAICLIPSLLTWQGSIILMPSDRVAHQGLNESSKNAVKNTGCQPTPVYQGLSERTSSLGVFEKCDF